MQAGDTGGVTCVTKPDLYESSFDMHEETIMRHLGGRAAVEVVYGVPDMGSETDFEMAYKILDHFTTELLINNRDFLDAVIEALVSKQTLTFKDIADIRGRLRVHLAIEASETVLKDYL